LKNKLAALFIHPQLKFLGSSRFKDICDLLQEKVFIFQKQNFPGERAKILVFPFFRVSHPPSQHLEAKGLQIEFCKFDHIKEGTFPSPPQKKRFFGR